ncbi:MAG: hypothetical protein MJ107_03625 [Lachnospiraceae bacterium]|nr:hypothetical protein [Lachnospiraceae bacterium]
MLALEVILLGCAVYMLVLTVKMNSSKEIPSFFVSSRIKMENAHDKEGYINYMTPRMYLFCGVLIVFSLISIASKYIFVPPVVTLVINILYFVILILYGVISVKAQNKFLFK